MKQDVKSPRFAFSYIRSDIIYGCKIKLFLKGEGGMLKAKQIDFSGGQVRQNIVAAASPMLTAQILNLLYNIIDRILHR